jgi:UDP-N-acetylglucosamine:LPS N-acetylglucosamine transferase
MTEINKAVSASCRIFVFDSPSDWEHIDKHIKIANIITNNYTLAKHLGCRTFRDIFPEEAEQTYAVYRTAKSMQELYAGLMGDFTYDGHHAWPGMENMRLLRHIILHEQARFILQTEGKDVAFVFDTDVQPVFFTILQTAQEMGFAASNSVTRLKGASTETTMSKTEHGKMPKVFALRLPKSIRRKRILKMLTAAFVMIDSTGIVKRMVGAKIAKLPAGVMLFMLTTNDNDLYLQAVYPVLDRLKDIAAVFVADNTTAKTLDARGIPYTSMEREIDQLGFGLINNKKMRDKARILQNRLKADQIMPYNYEHFVDIYAQACRGIAATMICDWLVKKLKPACAVLAADGGVALSNGMADSCFRHGIPTYFIPSTIINKNPLHSKWIKAEKICAYGLQVVESLTALGYHKDQIVLTGSPKYDKLKGQEKTAEARQLVVIAMSRWHLPIDPEWMSDIIKFCNDRGIEVVIKIHPLYKAMLHDESESAIAEIAKLSQTQNYKITYDDDLYSLFAVASVVITDYSNTGAEAALMGKPLITVNFYGPDSLQNEQRYYETGAAIHCEDIGTLKERISEIMEGKNLAGLAEGCKRLADLYNIYNDGKATDRIVELLINKENDVFKLAASSRLPTYQVSRSMELTSELPGSERKGSSNKS